MRTPVLIVGGGPVGSTLALDLAWRGIDVVVPSSGRRDEAPSVKCNHVAARIDGGLPPARHRCRRFAIPAFRPTMPTISRSAPRRPAGVRAHHDPVPPRSLHERRTAPTAGGQPRNRRIGSIKFTSIRCWWRTRWAMPGIAIHQPTESGRIHPIGRRRADARPMTWIPASAC